MSDWEENYSDDEAAVPRTTTATKAAASKVTSAVVPAAAWDDEESDNNNNNAGSDVADAWDASSSDDSSDDEDAEVKAVTSKLAKTSTTTSSTAAASPSPTSTGAAGAAANTKKRSIKQAIAERQAAEERERAEAAAKRAAADAALVGPDSQETAAERRLRLQKAVEAEDARLARELFGASAAAAAASKAGEPTLLTMTPRTKAEFEQYTTLVLDRFSDFEKFREYPGFLDTLARRLCEKLTKVEDIRKVSSTLNALANDRQRAEKEAAKKGKKTNTKKQVRVDAGDEMVPTARGVGGGLGEEAEAGAYYAGDDYDFM